MTTKSVRPYRRERSPSIEWKPAHDAHYVLASILRHSQGVPPLYVTQAALLQLETHLTRNPASLPFGLLAGKLCVCTRTKLLYLLLDEATRSRSELSDADDLGSQIRTELTSLASGALERKKVVLGWYIGGIGESLELDSDTISLHRELFPEPWQVVLVHDTESGVENGAFVRAEPFTDRTYPIPFYETLPEKAARGKAGEHLTTLRWVNYRSPEPVSPFTDAKLAELAAAGGRAVRSSPGRGRWAQLFRSAEITARSDGSRHSERKTRPIAPAASPAAYPSPRAPVISETLSPPPAPIIPPVAPVERLQEEARLPTTAEASDPSPEVLGPVQYIFLDGDLVSFADAPSLEAYEQPGLLSGNRSLTIIILAAVVLFLALWIWLLR